MMYSDEADRERLRFLARYNHRITEVLDVRDRILASTQYARVGDKAKLLWLFLTNKALLKNEDLLNEQTIASVIYEIPDFNPLVHTTVRVAVTTMRKRLEAYARSEGKQDRLRIELNGYVPRFDFMPLPASVGQPASAMIALMPLFTSGWNNSEERAAKDVNERLAFVLEAGYGISTVLVSEADAKKGPQEAAQSHGTPYVFEGWLIKDENLLVFYNVRSAQQNSSVCDGSASSDAEKPGIVALQIAEHLGDPNAFLTATERIRAQARREQLEVSQRLQDGYYQLALRTPTSVTKARDFFEQVLHLDANCAIAHSGLAECFLIQSWYPFGTPGRYWFDRARTEALKALQLAPNLPHAMACLGYSLAFTMCDWRAAEDLLRQAASAPTPCVRAKHWLGNLLVMQARFAEAQRYLDEAAMHEVDGVVCRKTRGDAAYYSGDYPKALALYHAALDQSHVPSLLVHLFIAFCHEQLKDLPKALEHIELASKDANENCLLLAARGHMLASLGHRQEAEQVLQRLHDRSSSRDVPPYCFALLYVSLGVKNKALLALEASVTKPIEHFFWIAVDPRFKALRLEPRFAALLKRIGLTTTTVPTATPTTPSSANSGLTRPSAKLRR
ncbi:MAG TPA: tetratricopeptide repeat protein [Bryobacteraceae bacterium]|nr:tetratricopeptide repeat protein [Bryobacteraceae bacterium]